MATQREFAVPPPSPLLYWLFGALWLAITAAALLRTHPAAWHADPVPWWLVPPFAAALVVVGPLLWLSRRSVALEDGQLVVAAGLNTLRLPVADLALEQARIVDLEEHSALKPMLKLFGVGLPGYHGGHYLLRDRSRAFVLLTGGKALVLPRRDGRRVLLSLAQPQALVDALREQDRATMSVR